MEHINTSKDFMQEKYKNEGFLYINTESQETFIRGEIKDANNNIICTGVIVPIINPIKESNRKVGYEHIKSIDSFMNQINYYYPLQKTKKIRIFWESIQQSFNISTQLRIYPECDETYDLSSVMFDLLDKNKCYYCDTNEQKGVILTNIVDKNKPCLLDSYNISEDLAFEHHIEWNACDDVEQLVDNVDKFENGIVFVLHDGQQIELRNLRYNYYCMLAKPDNISINMYYIMCLNRHIEGETFEEGFHSLHDYVREFIDAYPEYSAACKHMSINLLTYIDTYLEKSINMINSLLYLEPEIWLNILL